MGIEEKVKQAKSEVERIDILTLAIREAMSDDRTLEQFFDGRYALGYLVTWLEEKVRKG